MKDKENESSDGNSDIVLSVRNRKIRIVDSESKSDSDAPYNPNNSEWTPFEESSEIPPRIKVIADEKPERPQVSSNVEPLNFLKIFLTDKSSNN